MTTQVNERAQPRTASGAGPTGSTLEQVLGEVALVDGARRTEARVWLAFVAQAAVTPELATVLRNRYAGLHPLLVRLLRESRPDAPAPHGGKAPPTRSAIRARRHTPSSPSPTV